MKKILAFVLTLVMFSTFWISSSAEEDVSESQWVSVAFSSSLSSTDENRMMIKWDWNDLLSDAATSGENRNLAIAGLVMSNQAEFSKENAEDVLNIIGFTDISSEYYSADTANNNSLSNPARTFAHREIDVNGEKKHIICTVVRGTRSAVDVITDIKSVKDGFLDAGKNCLESLKNYQSSLNGATKENTILFITGHSLGASTAAVLSCLADEVAYKSATHTYTFATPNYNTMEICATDYNNMYQYTNLDDVVPKVPINFKKVGNEKFYDYKTLSSAERNRFDRVYEYFRKKTYSEDGDKITADLIGRLRNHMAFTYMCFMLSEKSDAEIDSYIAPYELPAYKAVLKTAKQSGKCDIKATAEKYSTCQKPCYEFSIMKDGKWQTKTSSTNSNTFKKLSKGNTYSVKVRIAKTLNGKTYYSKWSAAKKVKINTAPTEITSYKAVLKTVLQSGKNGIKAKAAACKICQNPTYEFSIKKNGKWKITKSSSTVKVFKKLTKGKTYSVKVRIAKTLNGITYRGKWSSVKKVRISK